MPINKITAKSIKDAEIVAADIAPGTITDAKIATGTITNAKLAGSIANAKLSNTAITINGTSIALGASGEIVAGTDWQAVTVADGSTTLTAVAGRGYFLDTNAGVIQVNFPSSPTRGDTIVLMDYAGHFALNNVLLNETVLYIFWSYISDSTNVFGHIPRLYVIHLLLSISFT